MRTHTHTHNICHASMSSASAPPQGRVDGVDVVFVAVVTLCRCGCCRHHRRRSPMSISYSSPPQLHVHVFPTRNSEILELNNEPTPLLGTQKKLEHQYNITVTYRSLSNNSRNKSIQQQHSIYMNYKQFLTDQSQELGKTQLKKDTVLGMTKSYYRFRIQDFEANCNKQSLCTKQE